jgi:hypothetical protein
MGRAIYYCVQCSKRVSDADIESGKGFRVGDRILCADCAPEDAKSASSRRIPAVARPKPGSTARTPKVPLPEPPAATALSPGRGMLVLGGGVLVLLLVVGLTLWMRTREGRPGEAPAPAPAPASPVAPTVRDAAPDSREAAARAELAKARDFAKAHPEDLSGRQRGFRDLILTWEGTEAGREAAKEADAVRAIIQEKVRGWMADMEEKIAELLKAKQYELASRKVEELKSSHDLQEWRLAAEKRASELYVLGKKLADEEEAKKANDRTPPAPGETPPPKPLSEEGKSQLARWEAAAARATARDYPGAIAELERSLPALKESDVRAEAAGDVALLRKVASAVEASLGALRQRSRGTALALEVRDASGATKRVSGVILEIDPERVELRSGKDTRFVDWSEVAPTTLADQAQKGAFDPQALAALCLLEGEPEAARAFRAELPAKWWTYAEGARGRLPKSDPGERAARDAFAAAESGYRSMDTRSAAIERYSERTLRPRPSLNPTRNGSAAAATPAGNTTSRRPTSAWKGRSGWRRAAGSSPRRTATTGTRCSTSPSWNSRCCRDRPTAAGSGSEPAARRPSCSTTRAASSRSRTRRPRRRSRSSPAPASPCPSSIPFAT